MAQENAGSAGKGFLNGITIHEAVKLFVIFMLGIATLYMATHDTHPNKAAFELEAEKTKQILAVEETKQAYAKQGIYSPEYQSKHQIQNQGFGSGMIKTASLEKEICYPMFDQNLGSYLISNGACVTFDNSSGQLTMQPFSVGTQTLVTAIEGDGSFTVVANDEQLSRCESAKSHDKCASWIREYQKIGREDSRFHIRRYWLSYFVHNGKMIIKTATP